MGCWGNPHFLATPVSPSHTPSLAKSPNCLPSSPFLRYYYGPSLTVFSLSTPAPPSITTASWWRRLQLHACPPVSRSSSSAPGKARCPAPLTHPRTGSYPTLQHLGNLGGAGLSRLSHPWNHSPGEGARPVCLVMGSLACPAPRPYKAEVGAGWKPVPSSHLCQNVPVPGSHSGILPAINIALCPPSGVLIPAEGPLWLVVCATHIEHKPGSRYPPS